MTGWSRWSATVSVLALGLALTACGDQVTDAEQPASPRASQESPSSSAPSLPEGPACDEIWVDGTKLPRIYKGCVSDEEWTKREALGCSSGQRLVTWGDRFYAVPGGTIREVESSLEQDRGYRRAVRICRG